MASWISAPADEDKATSKKSKLVIQESESSDKEEEEINDDIVTQSDGISD